MQSTESCNAACAYEYDEFKRYRRLHKMPLQPTAFALLALVACATPEAPTFAWPSADLALTALIAEKDATIFAAFNTCAD